MVGAVITAADIRATSAADGGNRAAADDDGAALALDSIVAPAAADACGVLAALGEDRTAVDGEDAAVGELAAADACAITTAGSGNRAAVDDDLAAVAAAACIPSTAAADACGVLAANGGNRAALNDDIAASFFYMTADAGAGRCRLYSALRSQNAVALDRQGFTLSDLNAAAISAAPEVVGALEDQGDICRTSKESHSLIVVRQTIVNGQIADPNRHGKVRFDLQALAFGAGGNERAGDGDLLRGIKVRRGQSAAVADLDLACRVAVQNLNGALCDVKDIAVGVACREHTEGQHRQKHAQRQENRSQPFECVLHLCFLLISE